MLTAVEPRLTRTRHLLAAATLGGLAFAQAVVGGWALAAPATFYTAFPGAGHAWVALLPPYNEHLVRDVGALGLALAVLLGAAARAATRSLVRIAGAAFLVYTVPHTLFHAAHLDGFTPVDAAAQTVGFAVQLVAAGVALASTVGRTDRAAGRRDR